MKRFLDFLTELSTDVLKRYKSKAEQSKSKSDADINKHDKLARHYTHSRREMQWKHDSRREFHSNNDYNASVNDLNHQYRKINSHIQKHQHATATSKKREIGLKRATDRLIKSGNKSGISTERLNSYIPKAEKSSTEKFVKASNAAMRRHSHENWRHTSALGSLNPQNKEIKRNFDKSAIRDRFVQRAKNVVEKRQKDKLKKLFPGNVK